MNYLIDRIWSRPRGIVNASYRTINDFESSSEKECSKFDKENEKIYSRLLSQAEKAHNAIKNSGLSMNLEVPIPPRPSNRDRYLLWKKRNVSKKVIEQTEAVLFLESQGYKYNEHYEAYQAVDLAMEVKKTKGEPIEHVDNSKNFDNVYNKNDKNIFRRRSMIRLKENESLPQDLQNKRRDKIVLNDDFMEPQTSPNYQRMNSISETQIVEQNQQHQQHQNNMLILQQPPPQPQQHFQQNVRFSTNPEQNSGILFAPPSAPPPQPSSASIKRSVSQRIVELNSTSSQPTPIPNFSQIENNNKLINDVKPSAPPASINLRRNNSSFGFDFEKNN